MVKRPRRVKGMYQGVKFTGTLSSAEVDTTNRSSMNAFINLHRPITVYGSKRRQINIYGNIAGGRSSANTYVHPISEKTFNRKNKLFAAKERTAHIGTTQPGWRSEAVKKAWLTRKRLYGESGRK
jgi:hypothetical protein